MEDRQNKTAEEQNQSRGPQGVDKAPGEETPTSSEQFISQTQKGKYKVDGDPSKKEDAPLDRQDIE